MEISLILTSGCCQSTPTPPLLCRRVRVVLKDSDRGSVGSAHAAETAERGENASNLKMFYNDIKT